MEYTTLRDVGDRKRQQDGINEDSTAINVLAEGHRDTDGAVGVFALADGAGGEEAGDLASYVTTVEVVGELTARLWEARRLDARPETTAADPPPTAGDIVERTVGDSLADLSSDRALDLVETAVQGANRRLVELVNELDLATSYSTVVVGIKAGDQLHYGWVGDSRIYVVNTAPEVPDDLRLSLLTRDHSVVTELLEAGAIDEIEAHVHRQGNRITRALGGSRTDDPLGSSVEVETGTVQLFRDDVVLFTSDGLVDAYTGASELHDRYERAEDTTEVEELILQNAVTDDDIRDVILGAGSLDEAARRLVELSNDRGGKDNLSVVLFRDGDLAPHSNERSLARGRGSSHPAPSGRGPDTTREA